MRIGIMTREWPPDIYGGAGVHVEQLTAQLRLLADVQVECFGEPRDDAMAFEPPADLAAANMALQTLGVDLLMADAAAGLDIMHSHTWYANLAGHLAALLHGVPHVITAHSLEPRRPWKEEQLGGGFRISSWVERTAYREAAAIIAVSAGMRADVLDCYPFVDPDRVQVVHNGIDTEVYRPVEATDALAAHGVGLDRPFALFVGRITRQKGLPHLLRAAEQFDPEVRLVLCASSPDTPELGDEVTAQVAALRESRGEDSVIWIPEQLSRPEVMQFYTQASVFVCPSVYEPQGIVNLEAMACETAVVASDVGGIPEVVTPEVGVLVHYDADATAEFEAGIAAGVNQVVADPAAAAAMGVAGRTRAIDDFGWDAIARRTIAVYEQALRS
ncbi:MAG: glycogen synthase [Candidatus Nanopelagicales bacterium]